MNYTEAFQKWLKEVPQYQLTLAEAFAAGAAWQAARTDIPDDTRGTDTLPEDYEVN